MTMVDRLLAQLKNRGFELKYVSDTELKLIGDKSKVDAKLMEALKLFKAELVERVRPRDMTLNRHDVHHEPPPPENQTECFECKGFVWDVEETAMLCEVPKCPMKRK